MATQPLSLDALLVLDAIDRRGSYALAAEELDRVPSAISYSVQKLEESLGVTLFMRVGRNSRLTPAGRFFLDNGRQLLTAAESLQQQTREVATGWEPRIRVALDSAYDPQPLFDAVAEFLCTHPSVDFDIREEVMSGGWEVLENDQVDLLVGGQGPVPGHQGYRSELMPALDMVLVLPPGHELLQKEGCVTAEDLSGQSLVVVHDSARQLVPRSSRFVPGRSYCFVQSMRHKLCAQLAGVGVGYVPRAWAARWIEEGMLIEKDSEMTGDPTEHVIAWKLANRGKGLKALIGLIRKHYGVLD